MREIIFYSLVWLGLALVASGVFLLLVNFAEGRSSVPQVIMIVFGLTSILLAWSILG